jgi:hypothetical protein
MSYIRVLTEAPTLLPVLLYMLSLYREGPSSTTFLNQGHAKTWKFDQKKNVTVKWIALMETDGVLFVNNVYNLVSQGVRMKLRHVCVLWGCLFCLPWMTTSLSFMFAEPSCIS